MGKIYRVLVIEQDDSYRDRFDTSVPVQRVLFEAAGPDASRLLAYAPAEVAAALSEVTGQPTAMGAQQLVDVAALAASLPVPAVAEPEPQAADAPAEPKVRRPRKRAAITEQPAAAPPADPDDRMYGDGATAAQALASQAGADPGPANQEALAAAVPQAVTAPAPAPVVAPPPGEAWNPFLQK